MLPRCTRLLLPSLVVAAALAGCALGTSPRQEDSALFPLPPCDASHHDACVAFLFASDQDRRERLGFPARYLELWNPEAVRSDPSCAGPEPDPARCSRLQALGRYFSDYGSHAPGGARPLLGVALEGGGTKSAPFALGVLAGLEQAGLLKDVGVLSSVSGGSYSAYYYMNRLLDRAVRDLPDGPQTWLQTCVPSWWEHQGVFDPIGPPGGSFDYSGLRGTDQSPFCGEVSAMNTCLRWLPGPGAARPQGSDAPMCLPPVEGCTDPSQTDPFRDHFKYRYQVLEYHNLISPRCGLTLQDERAFHLYPASRFLQLAVLHAVTVTPVPLDSYVLSMHHLSHTVFDWPIEFSPSGLAYREGIDRAYGFSHDDWVEHEKLGLDTGVDLRRRDDTRRLTELRQAYERAVEERCRGDPALRCGFPMWIADTTASSGRTLFAWLTTPTRDPLRHQFELSPVGQGSGIHGFADVPPELALTEVVGASAAFLDEEQRTYLTLAGVPGGVLDATIHALNLNWGINIHGFNASDGMRALHNVTPWPLYTAFVGRDAPYIHLDDGGNTDNQALLSQLRRGVRNVVASASSEDKKGQFPSLCRIKNQLELDHRYALLMPELQGLGAVCSEQLQVPERATWPGYRPLVCARMAVAAGRAPAAGDDSGCPEAARPDLIPLHYDLWAWKMPVLRGCVVRVPAGWRADQIAGLESEPPERQCPLEPERDCDAHPEEIDRTCLLSRLVVIKPVIDSEQVRRQLVDVNQPQNPAPPLCTPGLRIRTCRSANDLEFRNGTGTASWRHRDEAPASPMELSCDALAYLTKSDDCSGPGPNFPQHDVVFTTLQQDYTQYSAYFDMGRSYAAQLRYVENGRMLDWRNCGRDCALADQRMQPR